MTMSSIQKYLSTIRKSLDTQTAFDAFTRLSAQISRLEQSLKVYKTKALALEQEALRLRSLKDPFFDLLDTFGWENPPHTDLVDSFINPGYTHVIIDRVNDEDITFEVLVLFTQFNVAYGVILKAKNSESSRGMLVKFPLSISYIKQSKIKQFINIFK